MNAEQRRRRPRLGREMEAVSCSSSCRWAAAREWCDAHHEERRIDHDEQARTEARRRYRGPPVKSVWTTSTKKKIPTIRASKLAVVACCFLSLGHFQERVEAAEIEALSFAAPFTTVNSQGDRQVSKTWRASGSTSVHNNFARLTPDRQSKKGALWATKAIGASEVSVSLKFRISGQGKKYFGDGMALWLTESRSYRSGDFHGSTEKFRGVGVVIDTFKNAELLNYHKDVTIVFNEGGDDMETSLANSLGCNGDVRYHEDRGDFSVSSASRVKFVVEPLEPPDDDASSNGGDTPSANPNAGKLKLTVYLDANNSGEYRDCVAATPLPASLDANWLARAYLGITASTGQLADNHDVLSLQVFSDKEIHVEAEKDLAEEVAFESGVGVSPERFDRIEQMINSLLSKFDHLEHHLEHELVAVDDHVRVTLEKLGKQEQNSEKRIEQLEKQVLANVEDSLSDRISNLEQAMRDAVQKRLKTAEQNTMETITATVSDKLKNVSTSSWTKPFLFLIVVDVVAFVAVYKWYMKFKKDHLL